MVLANMIIDDLLNSHTSMRTTRHMVTLERTEKRVWKRLFEVVEGMKKVPIMEEEPRPVPIV